MGELSKIEWTTHTFNPWIGCTKLSAACTNCYAAVDTFARVSRGRGLELWGPKADRHVTSDANWRKPRAWNREAARLGERHRVFCASLSDVFEMRADAAGAKMAVARQRLWGLIESTPSLDWLLLTKRPENVKATVPPRWLDEGLPRQIWLGITAEDQDTYNERWPHAAGVPAAVRFVSYEPAMGPLVLRCAACGDTTNAHTAPDGGGCSGLFPDWVIVGGESGPHARPLELTWAESILKQCQATRIKPFVKQLGSGFFAPWKVRWDERLDGSLDAFSVDGVGTRGTNLATVWRNGVWHTWDANGTGGENSAAPTVELAKRQAIEALQRQHISPIKGWARHEHMLKDRKGGDWSEWPESLRVRQFPESATRAA